MGRKSGSQLGRDPGASPAGAACWLVALLVPGLLAGCSDTTGGSSSVTQLDERGWVPGQPGLFGFRRIEDAGSGIGSIGYSPGTEEAPAATGVLRHDHLRAEEGLNLMCSGDAAVAELALMNGTVVHRWEFAYSELPGAPPLEGPHQIPWRRVHLLEDGGLLAIHSGRALVCLDRNSKLRWVSFDRVHHDLAVAEDGTIFALARHERVVPEVNPDAPIVDDLVNVYGADGTPQASFSLWDAFARSEWAGMLDYLSLREGDVMHANSLELLDADAARALDLPGVAAGQLLVCMRDLDLVAAVETDPGRLTWLTQGPEAGRWRAPHDPTVAADGTILLFDNRGGPGETSRVLRIDPGTSEVAWSWQGDPPSSFASFFCGVAQELPGGNVLATESNQGRAIEIDPVTGKIVWEYVSDRLAGPNNEYVAALFAVERIQRPEWLER